MVIWYVEYDPMFQLGATFNVLVFLRKKRNSTTVNETALKGLTNILVSRK